MPAGGHRRHAARGGGGGHAARARGQALHGSGALVPDEVMIGLVGERLAPARRRRGLRPRRLPAHGGPGRGARRAAEGPRPGRSTAWSSSTSRETELLRRLTGRRVCRQCGTAFHLVSAPAEVAGRCDACGGELYQREDDSEATVAHRLDVYRRQTAPLLDYYREPRPAGDGGRRGRRWTRSRDAIRKAARSRCRGDRAQVGARARPHARGPAGSWPR